MNELLTDTIVHTNNIFYVLAGNFLALLNLFPYWISLALVSGLVGLAFIPVFKYCSNQRAVQRVRDQVTAHLMSIRIFKDNPMAMIRAQGRILSGSLALLWHTLPTFLIMIVPVAFLLAQMSGWYQFRPLNIGEVAVVTVKLADGASKQSPDIQMTTTDIVNTLAGPVIIHSQNEMVWAVAGVSSGTGHLAFSTPQNTITKTLAVGTKNLPVSIRMPSRSPGDTFLYPFEPPPGAGAPIHSITLSYGDPVTDPLQRFDWLVVFCLVSMLVFWIFKRLLKVVV